MSRLFGMSAANAPLTIFRDKAVKLCSPLMKWWNPQAQTTKLPVVSWTQRQRNISQSLQFVPVCDVSTSDHFTKRSERMGARTYLP